MLLQVHVPNDKELVVKIAFAECVADLSKTAHRFLELAQLKANQDADETSGIMQYQVQGSYDSELTQLQQSIQSKIVHLLTDSVATAHTLLYVFISPFPFTLVSLSLCQDALVKKALLRHSAGKLCEFFGPLRGETSPSYCDWNHCISSIPLQLMKQSFPT